MGQCHCKGCQKASGTDHMFLAFFKPEQLESKRRFQRVQQIAVTRTFRVLPKLWFTNGSRMLGRNSANAGIMAVAVGSSEDSSWFEPQFIACNEDKPE